MKQQVERYCNEFHWSRIIELDTEDWKRMLWKGDRGINNRYASREGVDELGSN